MATSSSYEAHLADQMHKYQTYVLARPAIYRTDAEGVVWAEVPLTGYLNVFDLAQELSNQGIEVEIK